MFGQLVYSESTNRLLFLTRTCKLSTMAHTKTNMSALEHTVVTTRAIGSVKRGSLMMQHVIHATSVA